MLSDPIMTKRFLDAAKGDKDVARRLAKQNGWTIE